MLGDSRDVQRDRKRRLTAERARDGRANGVVEVRGPVSPELERVIRTDVYGAPAREPKRDRDARILRIARRGEDLVIETESGKLASTLPTRSGRAGTWRSTVPTSTGRHAAT